jgi:acyl carrier protein
MPNYPLQDDESLVDSGLLDSFALVEVSVFVDTQFGVDIPDEAVNIDDMATLAQIVDAVLYWEQHQSDAELS